MSTTSPSQQLAAALADEPSRPLVTYYDDATGERTELSLVTLVVGRLCPRGGLETRELGPKQGSDRDVESRRPDH